MSLDKKFDLLNKLKDKSPILFNLKTEFFNKISSILDWTEYKNDFEKVIIAKLRSDKYTASNFWYCSTDIQNFRNAKLNWYEQWLFIDDITWMINYFREYFRDYFDKDSELNNILDDFSTKYNLINKDTLLRFYLSDKISSYKNTLSENEYRLLESYIARYMHLHSEAELSISDIKYITNLRHFIETTVELFSTIKIKNAKFLEFFVKLKLYYDIGPYYLERKIDFFYNLNNLCNEFPDQKEELYNFIKFYYTLNNRLKHLESKALLGNKLDLDEWCEFLDIKDNYKINYNFNKYSEKYIEIFNKEFRDSCNIENYWDNVFLIDNFKEFLYSFQLFVRLQTRKMPDKIKKYPDWFLSDLNNNHL